MMARKLSSVLHGNQTWQVPVHAVFIKKNQCGEGGGEGILAT